MSSGSSSLSFVRPSLRPLGVSQCALSVVMCYGICAAAADFWYTHYTVRRDRLVFRMLIDTRIM